MSASEFPYTARMPVKSLAPSPSRVLALTFTRDDFKIPPDDHLEISAALS